MFPLKHGKNVAKLTYADTVSTWKETCWNCNIPFSQHDNGVSKMAAAIN
jgi:hypothetical protein